MPANVTPDLAVILEGQAKIQQELADLRKRNGDEMEALREENSRLRRKIEADPTRKGNAKESSVAPKSPAYQPNKEENKYNPTPHTFTTTQQTPITQTFIPSFSGPPQHPPLLPPFPPPISHFITSPLPSLPSSTIPFHHARCHPNYPSVTTLSLMPSLTHLSPFSGTFHPGP